MASSSSNILEVKYNAVQPPELNNLSPEAIINFVNGYDRYVELFKISKEDEKKLVPMVDCVVAKWKKVLKFRYEDHLVDDKKFRDWLVSRCELSDASEVKAAFAKLCINMNIRDVGARYDQYLADFIELKERCGADVKEKALVKAFIAGLRPAAVRKSMEDMYEIQDMKIDGVIDSAENLVQADDESFRARRDLEHNNDHSHKKGQPLRYQQHAVSGAAPHSSSPSPSSSSSTYKPPVSSSSTSFKPEPRPHRDHQGICSICGGKWSPEHWSECTKKHPLPVKHVHAVSGVATGSSVPPIMLTAIIGNMEVQALFDSGASSSCISAALASDVSMSVPIAYAPSVKKAEMADSSVTSTRECTFVLTLPSPTIADKVTCPWTFLELPDNKKKRLIIGRDLLRKLGYLTDDGIVYKFEDKEKSKQVYVDDGLDDSVFGLEEVGDPSGKEQVKLVHVAAGPDSAKLWDVLNKHDKVFSADLPVEGAAFNLFHINTTPGHVVSCPARPISDPSMVKEVTRQIEEQLADGRLVHYSGAWGNAVVIVKKGDKVRVCGDYRQLNKISETIYYPLPDIRSLLQSAAGSIVFAKFDLRSGFNQVKVAEEDQEKLAIRTLGYHVMPTRLQYGPKNGPMFFQQEMSAIFDDLIRLGIMAIFIDDMLVFGHTMSEFVNNVEMVLQRCEKKNLRLKAPKCSVGLPEVEGVGYVLAGNGRHMSDARVTAVQGLKPPTTRRELQRVLGAFNYFREFLPDCAEIERPLYQLLEKDRAFIWNDECQSAFDKIKASMTSELILAYGTEPGLVVLKSDASGVAVGGVLCLRHPDGIDQPIGYYSKSLNKTQQHWSTIEQELYSIVYAVSQQCYAPILKSRKFLIETDHRNLVFLDKLSEANDKIMRWRILLMQFNFDIKHVSGESNVVADTLSRHNYEDVEPIDTICFDVQALSVESSLDKRIAEIQQKHKDDKAWRAYVYDEKDHLFYNKECLIVVPDEADEIKKELFNCVHGSAVCGHMGTRNTMLALRKAGYTWSGMTADVNEYIKRCAICQKTREISDPSVEMRTTMELEPMRCVAMDDIGPLPPDKHGNCHIQVMMCKCIRKVKLTATKSTDAVSAAEALMDRWILEYGVPEEIQSDNGSQYVNKVVEALVELLHVRHHRTVPYHPQANGIVERTNKEVMKHLLCLTVGFGDIDDWSSMLPLVESIINNTVHSALGVSPNVMLYGDNVLHCSSPFAYLKPSDDNSVLRRYPELSVDAKAYVDALTHRLNTIHESAKKCQLAVVKKRLERNNPPDKVFAEYDPGMFVFICPIKRTGKMETNLMGPYKVLTKVHDSLYMVQSLVDPTDMLKVHPERMRLFLSDNTDEEELIKLARFDKKEYLVDKILDHKGTTKKNMLFKVRWEGYGPEEDTDEPLSAVDGCDKFEDYLDAHPDVKEVIRGKPKH